MKTKLLFICIVLLNVFNDVMSGRVRVENGLGENVIIEDTTGRGHVCRGFTVREEILFSKLTGEWWEVITFNNYRRMEPRSCSVSYFYSKPINSQSKPNPLDKELTAFYGRGQKKPAATYKIPSIFSFVGAPDLSALYVIDDFATNNKYGKKEHNKLTWTLDHDGRSPKVGLIGTQFNGDDGVVTFKYSIIATNYKDYIFAYTCRDGEQGPSNLDGGVVLTKQKSLSKELIRKYVESFQSILANLVQLDTYSYFVHDNNLCEDVDFPKPEVIDKLFKKE